MGPPEAPETPHAPHHRHHPAALGDFAVDRRMIPVTGLALPIGALAGLSAWVLPRLIGLFTNLVFVKKAATDHLAPDGAHNPSWLILLAPVAGGLIVGVMARYGTEKIRGHGMPEAIEAILTGGSRVSPNVTLLNPLSAAVSIGTAARSAQKARSS